MPMWVDFFDQIYVINLDKRLDRWVDVCGEMEKFNIPFKRKAAVECPNGAEGLMRTMIEIFNEAIDKQFDNILVFEDDAMWKDEDVNGVMENVVKQVPDDYLMVLLGCQPTNGFSGWYSHNLLPVVNAYSTHAVMYSRKAIQLILASSFDFPIDNFFCSQIQMKYGGTYAVHPFLCTQRFGYSDIGKNDINWDVFLSQRHDQKIIELTQKGISRPPLKS